MGLGEIAKLFTGARRKPPPPRSRPGDSGALRAYKRTYGEKDGQTVFDAAQIKAKRKGRKR